MYVVKCYRCYIVYILLLDSYILNYRIWIVIVACKIINEIWYWIFYDRNIVFIL